MHKTSIRFDPAHPVITTFHYNAKLKRFVYILRADKPVKYKKGRSRIIYIGESGKKGIVRAATSVARKADQAFGLKKAKDKLRGVTKIDVHLLTFRRKQRVKLWEILERNLLAKFKELYNQPPRYNYQGTGQVYSADGIKLFTKKRLETIITKLS